MTNEELQTAINALLSYAKERGNAKSTSYLEMLLAEQVRRASNGAIVYNSIKLDLTDA